MSHCGQISNEERFLMPQLPTGSRAALSGLKVVDLTQYEAGTSCTQALAWLGADVAKIEPPSGESGRFASTNDKKLDSYYFILMNANKRSVVCDLKSETGKATLKRMIERARHPWATGGDGGYSDREHVSRRYRALGLWLRHRQ